MTLFKSLGSRQIRTWEKVGKYILSTTKGYKILLSFIVGHAACPGGWPGCLHTLHHASEEHLGLVWSVFQHSVQSRFRIFLGCTKWNILHWTTLQFFNLGKLLPSGRGSLNRNLVPFRMFTKTLLVFVCINTDNFTI